MLVARGAVAVPFMCIATAALLRSQPSSSPTADDISSRLAALAPVLNKLQSLDPKAFSTLNGMISQAEGGAPQKTSFLQYLRDEPVDVRAKMEKLGPILDHLKKLDPQAFGMLNNAIGNGSQAVLDHESMPADTAATHGRTATALLQKPADDSTSDALVAAKFEALAPVLEKLKGLDNKAFGMLNGMVQQAEQATGRSQS